MKIYRIVWGCLFLIIIGQGARADELSVKLVVIGNSITRTGPSPSVGWRGDWGMAASGPDKDYVSLLEKALNKMHPNRQVKVLRISGSGLEALRKDFQIPRAEIDVTQQSQVVVVQLGDNVSKDPQKREDFGRAYRALLSQVKPSNGILICVGTWWSNYDLDNIMKSACNSSGGRFAQLGDLSSRPGMRAESQYSSGDPGVLSHPSDLGMQEIANEIAGIIVN